MMKKQYIVPHTDIVEMRYSGILAVSGNLGDDATGPAMGRDLFDFDDTDDENLNQILKLM